MLKGTILDIFVETNFLLSLTIVEELCIVRNVCGMILGH
jgi:hypothetical protein